jgi:hypothetical protein
VSCAGSVQLRCPVCRVIFCVPATCRGHIVWHRGCDGDPLAEEDDGFGEPVVRSVVSWFADSKRNEVRPCADR